MTPGPKPKGTPRRQTLGVAVQPWTLNELDHLIEQFNKIEEYVPEWFKLPSTRSGVAAWILERCVKVEMEKLSLVITTGLEGINEINCGSFSDEEKERAFSRFHDMLQTINQDEFFLSIHDFINKNSTKLLNLHDQHTKA